jgi:predicted nuclease of restriction endonuclease-like (RecB) superfamily
VHAAQIRAGLAANRELLVLYWDIGRMILDRQKAEGWGAKVIDRLSRDLQNEFPGRQGFSPRNLKYMRAFAEAWPETVIVQQPAAQLAGSGKVIMHPPDARTSQAKSAMVQAPLAQSSRTVAAIVQQPAAQIPWTHHCLLLDKLSSSKDRLWYAAKALENGWSRPILALQIESGLHTRQGKALTNFKATLPPPQSDLAQQITNPPWLAPLLVQGCEACCGFDMDLPSALNRLLSFLAGFESIAPVPIILAPLARCAAAILALLDGHAGGGSVHAP